MCLRVCVIAIYSNMSLCLCSIWRLQEITGVLPEECVTANDSACVEVT